MTMTKEEMLNNISLPVGTIASTDDNNLFIFDGSNWFQTIDNYEMIVKQQKIKKQKIRKEKLKRLYERDKTTQY